MTRHRKPPRKQDRLAPLRRALTPMGEEVEVANLRLFKVVRAPPVIDFADEESLQRILKFLSALRRVALYGDKPAFVDLRPCRRVGPAGAMLLAAEIERCNELRPGRISGCQPEAPGAQRVLTTFGFWQAIGMKHPEEAARPGMVAQIRSGTGVTDDLPEQLSEVAELAHSVWGDQAFTDRVHAVLNEAVTNVLMHAYDPALLDEAEPCAPGRWWVAGVAPRGSNSVWFIVFDQGVGIPRSAPFKHRGLKAYLAEVKESGDENILFHVITEEGRSRTGLPQHGRGVPSMISLIKDKANSGSLRIFTGRAAYLLDNNPARPPDRRLYQIYSALNAKVPGTLIMWEVRHPRLAVIAGQAA